MKDTLLKLKTSFAKWNIYHLTRHIHILQQSLKAKKDSSYNKNWLVETCSWVLSSEWTYISTGLDEQILVYQNTIVFKFE